MSTRKQKRKAERDALKKKIGSRDIYLIRNSENDKQFLHPYPHADSKQYIWAEGEVGAAGWFHEEAVDVCQGCTPPGVLVLIENSKLKHE